MKKTITIIALLAIIITLISACGNSSPSGKYDEFNDPLPPDFYDAIDDELYRLNEGIMENTGGTGAGSDSQGIEDGRTPVPIEYPILDLPLMVSNTTLFHVFGQSQLLYIDNDNIAKMVVHGYGSRGEKNELLQDVRSISMTGYKNFFFIKNDNSLWAMGDNSSGQLGDGTGVDRDAPVEVMKNVANIYLPENYNLQPSYLITFDKELYVWGNISNALRGEVIYAPEKIMDDVVMYCGDNLVIKSDGTLWLLDFSNGIQEVNSFMERGDVAFASGYTVIDGNSTLWAGDMSIEDVLLYGYIGRSNNRSHYIIKKDNTLWAWGANTNGQLGDSTKVNRDEPVLIMDNVSEIPQEINIGISVNYCVVDNEGNYWEWNSKNPTPLLRKENVLQNLGSVGLDSYIFLSTTGELFIEWGGSDEELADNIKLPSSFVVN